MRWTQLFEDLEGRMAAEDSRQFGIEVAERIRVERAAVELAARLAAARGASVSVVLRGGERMHGVVAQSAPQWLLLEEPGRQHLIPVGSVAMLSGVSTRLAPVTEVERRLSLGSALRALSRDRARVAVNTVGGECRGVLGAVGADHVEVHDTAGASTGTVVPFHAIVAVSSASQ